ncbi:MAG: 6-carboxytetrahydropterin synthase [Candidatus Glassbacteria bacterium]|nr:6-carboxytetrahydropterin synthase [Candidatus Glassbacteria bacterium]
MVYLTRAAAFCASHRYHNPDLSAEDNRKLFGKCNYPHGHGHNYVVEVAVAGEPDPVTGMVINLSELDKVIERAVIEPLDHRHLNLDVPEFERRIPTTENLARFIWDSLAQELEGCSLHRVRLYESPDLYVDYLGE